MDVIYNKVIKAMTEKKARKCGPKDKVKIADNGDVIYQYYDTEVVKLHPDKSVSFQFGGFATEHTKRRIQAILIHFYPARFALFFENKVLFQTINYKGVCKTTECPHNAWQTFKYDDLY